VGWSTSGVVGGGGVGVWLAFSWCCSLSFGEAGGSGRTCCGVGGFCGVGMGFW